MTKERSSSLPSRAVISGTTLFYALMTSDIGPGMDIYGVIGLSVLVYVVTSFARVRNL
jgi:hypothetical protein